jgi:hypothetical protein
MPPISGAATEAVLIAAIPEETIKFLVLLCLALKHVDVCRQQDILVLSLAVSLGFATLENFFFVISVGEWKITAALRAITSVPGHGIDGMAMGALLIAAWSSGQTLWRFSYALIVPVILHAAYDFPLLALKADLAQVWFGAAWLAIIAVSSLFVIALCNRALTAAAAADRASGRDVTSVETTDRLIAGGILAMLGGPLLAAFAFNANGSVGASAATVLSIFPIAFGIDSIRTGLARRKIRLARAAEAA